MNLEGFKQGTCYNICGQAQSPMQLLMLSKVVDLLRSDQLELPRYGYDSVDLYNRNSTLDCFHQVGYTDCLIFAPFGECRELQNISLLLSVIL